MQNKRFKEQNDSDEIDLGQLFQMIRKGFANIFNAFLKVFIYFKKNALILIGLVIMGVAIGFGLKTIISKSLKTEVVVKPNLDSKNYLYDVIDEIDANIKAKDTSFFENIGVKDIDFRGLGVSISREENKDKSENDAQYLEMLQEFDDIDVIADIVRAELKNKTSFNHKITFIYKDARKGEEFAKSVLDYINTNEYFNELIKVTTNNAQERIKQNVVLLDQVDELIKNYSKKLSSNKNIEGGERFILENQEALDVTGLLELKNKLVREIEDKKIELKERTTPIKIINFGNSQEVKKSFFGKSLVFVPTILIGLFFLFSFFRYLDKKAKHINA